MKRSRMPKPDPDKLRAWQRRSKPINPRNAERSAKMYAKNYGDRADAIRAMHCLTVPLHSLAQRITCKGRIVAAHAKARGMGGCKGDRRELVNLCWGHHEEAGEHRTPARAEFEKRWGVDLVAEAAKLAERLDAAGYE